MANDPRYFTWYELMTTDVAAAATFYRDVVGWGTQEASTSKLPYKLFATGEVPTAGLMELPEEGRKMGARPRWMGYVGVSDVHVAVGRIRRLGGAVYVPPIDTNIGMISVVTGSCDSSIKSRIRSIFCGVVSFVIRLTTSAYSFTILYYLCCRHENSLYGLFPENL